MPEEKTLKTISYTDIVQEVIDITRTIYIDVLIGVNVIINYFILLAVSKYSKIIPKQSRMILGSLFGAVCSLVILLPNLGFILNLLIKFIVSVFIVFFTFGFHRLKALIKNIALFYFISFCFCGVMLFVWFVFTPKGLVINNSTVYFNISPIVMIATTVISYIVIRVCSRFIGRKENSIEICKIKLINNNSFCEFYGKIDTGNTLCEPFSQRPVIVVNEDAVKNIAEDEFSKLLDVSTPTNTIKNKYRVIPFSAVGGTGILPAFSPSEVYINGIFCKQKIYVAVCKNDILCGEIKAMVNPEIIEFVKE